MFQFYWTLSDFFQDILYAEWKVAATNWHSEGNTAAMESHISCLNQTREPFWHDAE